MTHQTKMLIQAHLFKLGSSWSQGRARMNEHPYLYMPQIWCQTQELVSDTPPLTRYHVKHDLANNVHLGLSY